VKSALAALRTHAKPAPVKSGFGVLALNVFHYFRERFGLVNRQMSKHLAIDFYALSFHSSDKPAVSKPIHPGGGIDTHNPERAKISFLGAPVAISVYARTP
jgi:hypothetical protein